MSTVVIAAWSSDGKELEYRLRWNYRQGWSDRSCWSQWPAAVMARHVGDRLDYRRLHRVIWTECALATACNGGFWSV